jgi:hypothetical protein
MEEVTGESFKLGNGNNTDLNDPDTIAARPPVKAIDAKTFFQVGNHEGKWSEYDERGVPTKNIKKKKPTKKEKEQLETEYLDASKAYQKYLKDVETWEQAKLDAENGLKKSDRLRWSFRQVGDKHQPIDPDDMETMIKLMGWKALSVKEFQVIRKGLLEITNNDGQIELEALRVFVRDVMPISLLEVRLQGEQLDAIELEDLYSPRTWRRKIESDPPPKKKGKSPRQSPRASAKQRSSARRGTMESPRASPRGAGKKATLDVSGASPRAPAKKATNAPSPRAGRKSQKAR